MDKELLKKYIEYSEICWEDWSFEIKWNLIWFYDENKELLVSMSIEELLDSDIFIGCLAKKTRKSEMEFRFLHKNTADVEDYVKTL